MSKPRGVSCLYVRKTQTRVVLSGDKATEGPISRFFSIVNKSLISVNMFSFADCPLLVKTHLQAGD
jgi:hypothetical protein